MLGKLFSTAASSLSPRTAASGASRPPTSLESVQEDIHTRNLLFPDAEALYQHQRDQVFPLSSAVPLWTSSSNAFDVHPEIELDLRDVRVVILQEATSLQTSAVLLYDSQPLIEPAVPTERQASVTNGTASSHRAASGRTITSPRRISLGQASKPVIIAHEGSVPRSFGAFDRRPSNHNRATSFAETEGQRSAREYREEMTTFSSCIFGSSDVMAYKGTGTKVHIIPTETRAASYSFDGQGSLGRSSMRSSRLAQSYTSESILPAPAAAGNSGSGAVPRSLEKKKVLITRIFPVSLPNTEGDSELPTPTLLNEGPDGVNGYPFAAAGGENKTPGKKPKQKRTPMYAIGLIIQLPTSAHLPFAPASRSGFRGPGSFTDQESFPSSFNSLKPSGWTVLGNGFGVESLDSSVFSDFDDRMDLITQHWDIIMRTLSQLQGVVSANVLAMLKQVDIASPDLANLRAMSSNLRTPLASISVSGKRVDETIKPFKVPGSNAKLVQLMPNALAYQQKIKTEVDNARQRIVSGIKTLQVVTRQGRWGIWREEARWVSRWAGGKEQGFFFYNVLTGCLGTHTEWLRALAPEAYRRHHYLQQRANRQEDTSIAARTVVVAHAKMAARRLIFLLSAFLPPNQQQLPFTGYRPRTAASFDGYSQSPPPIFPSVAREESLRRRVKRRNGPIRGTHSRTMSFQTQASGMSAAPGLNAKDQDHERRVSDVTSLKTANLPIPGSDGGSRKSSAATTTTATPATTIPHFSMRRSVRGTGPIPRPGSSGSLAADEMMRSLKRGDSTGQFSNASSDPQGNSRWGSMISGFWSNIRAESTSATDGSPSVQSSEGGHPPTEQGKLAEMVEEVQQSPGSPSGGVAQAGSVKTGAASLSFSIPVLPGKVTQLDQDPRPVHPSGAYESAVKTSINEEDGVIDIDVPLPDFITSSFGSTMSSPSSSGYLSAQGFGPGLEGFEHYSRRGADMDMPLNVGGWLPRYHPDFTLQAIPPQDRLEEEIKASMSAEPTPALSPPGPDETSRWVDISTTLIADATNFSIKRIRYRRHIMLSVAKERRNSDAAFKSASRYGNPYGSAPPVEGAHAVIEETFTEDAVLSVDETLIDAVEKMTSQSGSYPTSKPGSGSSSRSTSTSRMRNREGSDSTTKGAPPPTQGDEPLKVPEAHLGVPRHECKRTILGALEEIVRQVAEDRGDVETTSARSDQTGGRDRESILREGIRGWMMRVEDWA